MGTGSLGTRQQPRLGGSVQYCLRDLLGLSTVRVTSVDVPMKCGAFNPTPPSFPNGCRRPRRLPPDDTFSVLLSLVVGCDLSCIAMCILNSPPLSSTPAPFPVLFPICVLLRSA